METNKIPAIIDGKNVTMDWIDEVFDRCECLFNGKQVLGYVDGKPVYAYIEMNRIFWKPVEQVSAQATLNEIKDRLMYWEDNQSYLFSEFYESNHKNLNYLEQHFYYKE